MWVEEQGRVDSQPERNFTSEPATRTGGAQEHVAKKSCNLQNAIFTVWRPDNIPYVEKKQQTSEILLKKKKVLAYCKKVRLLREHIHEAVLSQHEFILLLSIMLITCFMSECG